MTARRLGALAHAEQGTATVEYAIVLSLVSLGAALAIAAMGVPLLELFRSQQAALLCPVP